MAFRRPTVRSRSAPPGRSGFPERPAPANDIGGFVSPPQRGRHAVLATPEHSLRLRVGLKRGRDRLVPEGGGHRVRRDAGLDRQRGVWTPVPRPAGSTLDRPRASRSWLSLPRPRSPACRPPVPSCAAGRRFRCAAGPASSSPRRWRSPSWASRCKRRPTPAPTTGAAARRWSCTYCARLSPTRAGPSAPPRPSSRRVFEPGRGRASQPIDVAHGRLAEEPLVLPAEVRRIVVTHPVSGGRGVEIAGEEDARAPAASAGCVRS